MLIAFDLDGVLYSSEPFLGEAYREAIGRVNVRRPGALAHVPTTEEILKFIGWPVPEILAGLFPDADEVTTQLLHEATLDVICGHVAARDGVLYPDVAETLRRLQRDGFRLVVASNGRTRYVETVLRTYELGALFLPRVTADMVGDKTNVLRAYVQQLQIAAHDTVMIGDRASDVEAAQAVGCRFIGCDYGHGHRDEIVAAGPLVAHFADLPDVIAQTLRG